MKHFDVPGDIWNNVWIQVFKWRTDRGLRRKALLECGTATLLFATLQFDKVSVKVSNWWSTATPWTAYHRLFSLQEGSCVWVSRGLGGVLKWEPPCNALIFEFAPFIYECFNEAFWLVRNNSQITMVSMKIITIDARNGGNYIFEL